MFFWLWILSIALCFLLTLFPIRANDSLNASNDISAYIERFVEIALIVSTFVLITSNRTHDDLINYQYHYVGIVRTDETREFIFRKLNSFFYEMGLNFFQFRAIMFFLCGTCAIVSIRKACVKVTSVLLFFLPVMMLMDSIQFRNAICLYILLLMIHLLGEEKKIIPFIAVILLLSQIHSAFAFYLILVVLFIKEEKRKFFLAMIAGISFSFSMITFLNDNRFPFVDEIVTLFLGSSDDRITRYATTGRFGFLYPTMVHSITLILLFFSQRGVFLNGKDKTFVQNVTGILICSYAVVPFVMMNMNYYRILRNAYVVSILGFMVLFRELRTDFFRKVVLFVGLIFVMLLWGVFEIGIYNPLHEIVDPIFKDGVWFWDNHTGVL